MKRLALYTFILTKYLSVLRNVDLARGLQIEAIDKLYTHLFLLLKIRRLRDEVYEVWKTKQRVNI